MSDIWILSSLRVAEKKARERSKELHRQANCERRRAILLENAAIQMESHQLSLQEATLPIRSNYKF